MFWKDLLNIIDRKFPRGKKDEVWVVVKFLENEDITYRLDNLNINTSPEEPIDVSIRDIDKNFQVVVGDFELNELSGKAKPDNQGVKQVEFSRHPEDIKREFIIKPLQKKSKYGKAARGVILLIDCPFQPPWLESLLLKFNPSELQLKDTQRLTNLGFDQIYWVCNGKNLTRRISFDSMQEISG